MERGPVNDGRGIAGKGSGPICRRGERQALVYSGPVTRAGRDMCQPR